MTVDRWRAIPDRCPGVAIDAFVVMPDHVPGILVLGSSVEGKPARATTGDVIRSFKSSVHAAYRTGAIRFDWPAYDRHRWQRDYYDRIIRTDKELEHFRRYVDGNPARWWERHQSDSLESPA